MTKTQQVQIAAILTTLAEVEYAPESIVYLAGQFSSLDDWYQLKYALTHAGLISESNNAVTITPSGKALATKINDALASVPS